MYSVILFITIMPPLAWGVEIYTFTQVPTHYTFPVAEVNIFGNSNLRRSKNIIL
jgi:hypothetical protein